MKLQHLRNILGIVVLAWVCQLSHYVEVLKAFLDVVNRTLTVIQGLSTLLNEQNGHLKRLVENLKEDCGVEGPGNFEEKQNYVLCESYQVSFEHAIAFIKDQDVFAANALQELSDDDDDKYKMVLHSTALLFAFSVNGLKKVIADRDNNNGPSDNFPPVLPHELVKLRPFNFSEIVVMQNARLGVSYTEEEIISINDEFKLLKTAYRYEDALKNIIDGFNYKTTFVAGWRGLVDRFPRLCNFVQVPSSLTFL